MIDRPRRGQPQCHAAPGWSRIVGMPDYLGGIRPTAPSCDDAHFLAAYVGMHSAPPGEP